MQYEVSMDAYKRLSNTTDAKGRKLQIYKLPRPPPMFRTFKEANGMKVCSLLIAPELLCCWLLMVEIWKSQF